MIEQQKLVLSPHMEIYELVIPKDYLLRQIDAVITPSSLTKFRKLRLKDMNLLDMRIAKTVQIALHKGIIKLMGEKYSGSAHNSIK